MKASETVKDLRSLASNACVYTNLTNREISGIRKSPCFFQILFQHFLQFFYNATILPNRDSHPQLRHILPHTSVHSNLFFAVFWTAHLLLYLVRHIDQSEPIEHSVYVGHSPDIPQSFRAIYHFSYLFNIP